MLRSCRKGDYGASFRCLFCFKANQARHRHVIRPGSALEIRLEIRFRGARVLFPRGLDCSARTLVSRYSSRWRQAILNGADAFCNRSSIRPPSSVVTISVATSMGSTPERISPRLWPSSTIERRRPSQEPKALRTFARSAGLPSSESVAVFRSGHPPGTSPPRRSPKVPHDLFQAIHRIGDFACLREPCFERKVPCILEGLACKLLLAFGYPRTNLPDRARSSSQRVATLRSDGHRG